MVGAIIFIIFIVLMICAIIHDNKPEVKKEYEDQFMRSIGVDPNSEHAQVLKTMTNAALLNEQIKKKEQKKETAEIVKGAVVGGIVAGDAGAVVGATIAKNKIDNRKNNSSKTEWTPSIPYIPQTQSVSSVNQSNRTSSNTHTSQTHSTSSAKSIECNSFSGCFDASNALEFHHSDDWYDIKNQLIADSSTNTNNLSEDVEYCISRLGVILCSDLQDILGEQLSKTRPCLTPLMNEDYVERVELNGKAYFFWKKEKANNTLRNTRQILNYYGSEEWKAAKENLLNASYSTVSGSIKKCASALKVFKLGDLMDIFKCSHGAARGALTPLITDKFIKRIEENGRPLYVVSNATFESTPNAASTVPAAKASAAKPAIGNDAPPVLKHYKSEKWNNIFDDLRNNSSWKTGNISKDVEYCIAKLEIVTLGELSILTKEPANKTRPCITPLMETQNVTRFEYDGRTYFAWEQGQHSTVNARKALSTAMALNYYNGAEWQNTKHTLMENGFTKTGRLEGDVLYCLSLLKIACVSDLSDILGESVTVIRPKLTPLMNDETVKRIEHNGRAIFVMADADFNAKPAIPTNNVNKFDEVKKFKELLDSGIISQEEFDAKKKQLLGL